MLLLTLWFGIFNLPYVVFSIASSSDIVVASYNLWNIMFHWNIRKQYISEMIQDVNADIIGFQEVRADINLKHSQLDDLQMLLPEYAYKVYFPIEKVSKKYLHPGWAWEGVGFLSRHKIITSASINMTRPFDSPDANQRVVLHCKFLIDKNNNEVDVLLTHFSYDKQTQCSNAYEVMKYVYNIGMEGVIILGDLNVYEDFPAPVNALSNGKFEDGTLCEDIGDIFNQPEYQAHGYKFQDVWAHVNPHHPGFTFSNLPVPGLINRPDRILVSNLGLEIASALILGKGQFYKYKYGHRIHMDRYKRVFSAAREGRLNDEQTSSCAMDCGPRGSCRCGICVSGGDKNNCEPTECRECSAAKLFLLYAILLMLLPCTVYIVVFLTLFVLHIFKPRYRRTLINAFRLRRFTSWTGLFIASGVVILLLIYTCFAFRDVSRIVSMQMMEETNPSDHLMIVARLNLIWKTDNM